MLSRFGRLGVLGLCAVLVGCQGTSSVRPPTSEPPASEPPASPSPEPPSSPPTVPPGGSAASDSFDILPATQPAGFSGGISCTGPIGASDPVAVVGLDEANGSAVVLMDFADPSAPRIACTLGNGGQLIDPRHLLIPDGADGGKFAVVDLPAVRYHWFGLPPATGDFPSQLLAVAPDLGEVAWNEVENGMPFDRIHLANRAGDRVVAKVPDTNGGRCGSPTDSNPAAYTRSGSALFVLDEPLPEISLLVVKAGRLALSLVGSAGAATSTRPLKALWSPTSESLFYTQSGSVWRWTQASGSEVFLGGVAWESATISPDGAHLAYDLRRSDGQHDTYLLDLAQGRAPLRIGGGHRGAPAFLDAHQLLYFSAFQLTSCGDAPQAPLIYNLSDGTEVPTSIGWVQSTWPATRT